MEKIKTSKQMERHFKGVANYHRIDMLRLIHKQPNITVDKIADILNLDIKNASQHLIKLSHSGLVNKRYKQNNMTHMLSPYGKKFITFIKAFYNSIEL